MTRLRRLELGEVSSLRKRMALVSAPASMVSARAVSAVLAGIGDGTVHARGGATEPWRYDACARSESLGCVNYARVLLPYGNARRRLRFDNGRELTCSPNGSTCAAKTTQCFSNRDREDDIDNAIVNHTRGIWDGTPHIIGGAGEPSR